MSQGRKGYPQRSRVNPAEELRKAQEAYRDAYARETEAELILSNYPDITPHLNFAMGSYNLNALITGSLSERNMRKEYSRLRSIANKRIERLQKSELSNTSFVQEHTENFARLWDLEDYEVAYELSRLVKFLRNPSSLLTYQRFRQERVRSAYERKSYGLQIDEFLHGKRETFDSMGDVVKDPQFMEWLDILAESRKDRAFYEELIGMSGIFRRKHVNFQEILQDAGITTRDALNIDSLHEAFDYWIKNKETLEKAIPDKPKTAVTAADVRAIMRSYGK